MSDPTDESPAESEKQGLALAMTANRAGILPIHAAAIAGCLTCCSMLYMAASASPEEGMLLLKDKRGLTAAAYAVQQGNEVGYLAFTASILAGDKQRKIESLEELVVGAEQVMRVASWLLDDVLLNCVY